MHVEIGFTLQAFTNLNRHKSALSTLTFRKCLPPLRGGDRITLVIVSKISFVTPKSLQLTGIPSCNASHKCP